mgnify:CR=1 FL=1
MGFPSAAPSERRALELILEGKKQGPHPAGPRDHRDVPLERAGHRRHARHARAAWARSHPTARSSSSRPAPTSTSSTRSARRCCSSRGGSRRSGWTCRSRSTARPTSGCPARPSRTRAAAGVEQIEFGGEDGSRADVGYLIELAEACYKAGGTRYSFPDTVGFFAPEGVDYYIPKLVARVPDKPLVVHFHNDFGLGAYNTVRALHHGATVPTCTVNGIGERAGNAPLHTTVMILKELYGITIPGFRYDMLWRCAARSRSSAGLPVGATEPIIGHNVFSHETGIHTAGITIHPAIYQVIEPEIGGRPAALPVRQALGRDGDRGGAAAPPRGAGGRKASRSRRSLVQLLLAPGEGASARRRRLVSQHLDGVRNYYAHLERLGLTEEDLVAYALVLGRRQD